MTGSELRSRVFAAAGSRRRPVPSWRRSIATQLFLAELAMVLLLTAIASVVALRANRSQVERLSGEKALAIARSVAALPEVRSAFAADDPAAVIQPIAEAIRVRSGADFVVVANTQEIRYSHPDSEKVGLKLSTPAGDVLLGREFVGTERGTLGRSVRGKTPVRSADGTVIGLVSVGLLIEGVQARARADLIETISYLFAGAVVLGGLAAALVARRVRRQTYSLDAESIGALLEHREAILSSVKEGVVAVDPQGRITLVNDEARRLLALPEGCVGASIDSFGLDPNVIDAVMNPAHHVDRPVRTDRALLIANRRAITIRGTEHGGIVTLRDRTELDRLTGQLEGTRAATDTLRAQAHEFSNKIHTIGGLLALGAYDEAANFVHHVGESHSEQAAEVANLVLDRRVAAMIVAKKTLAAERNIDLRLHPASSLPELSEDEAGDLLVVIGNLLDNAFHAVDHSGWVEVVLTVSDHVARLQVVDSGPGVSGPDPEAIFSEGWSTKMGGRGRAVNEIGVEPEVEQPIRPGDHFGLGLALARRSCQRRGGSIEHAGNAPTTFEALMPLEVNLEFDAVATRVWS